MSTQISARCPAAGTRVTTKVECDSEELRANSIPVRDGAVSRLPCASWLEQVRQENKKRCQN